MHINLKVLYRTDARVTSCPDCNKFGSLKRSRSRNTFEKMVKYITPFTTFRCKECGWRGFKSNYIFKAASFKAIMLYIILLLGTAFIVRFIILRFIVK